MPQLYKFDLKQVSPNVKIIGQSHSRSKVYYNEYEDKYGNGFGSIGELVKTGINLVRDNKDLLIEGGKAASSVANAVSKVSKALKSEKDLQLIKDLRKRTQSVEQSNLSDNIKNKIAKISHTPTENTGNSTAASGDGIAKF